MVEEFLLRAALVSVAVALMAGPLGCFVVWRRMAYFGDAMAHSALLGVGLGFLLGIDLMLGVFAVTLALALLLVALQRQSRVATDTLLGILSHGALSAGLVLLAAMTWLRVDLMGYLFGDVLAVTWAEVALVWGGGALVLATLAAVWRPLLALTVHEEMARAEGIPDLPYRIAFMVLMAVVVAVAMKVVGVILITALLIVPAAAARGFARTPEAMAALAALLGALASALGLAASFWLDTPSGPSIVLAAALLFALSLAARPLLGRAS